MKNILYKIIAVSTIFVPVTTSAQSKLVQCTGAEDCNFVALMATLNAIVNFVVILGVAIVAIVITMAGFTYLTASGDMGKVKKAHKMFTDTVVGFIIMLAAYLIVKLFLSSLGVDNAFNLIT